MEPEPFSFKHRVTYSDCTLGDHIYHSRYLDILEAARGELFRSAGKSLLELQEQDVVLPVIECAIKYLAQAHYDDVLDIAVRVLLAEGARVHFEHTARDQRGRPILEARTFHACTNRAGRVRRVPEEMRLMLAPFLSVAPAGGLLAQKNSSNSAK